MGQELSSLGIFLALGAVATRTDWSTSFFCLGVALLAAVAALGRGSGARGQRAEEKNSTLASR